MCQLERSEANALLGVAASEHRLFTVMKHVLVAEAARLESATEHPAANAAQVVDVQADGVAAAASGAGPRIGVSRRRSGRFGADPAGYQPAW